jgi:hypothetical protein
MQIWEYAMNCAYIGITIIDWIDDSLRGIPTDEEYRRTPEVALHLPETSWQIYNETHLLISKLATFRIPCEHHLRAISRHAMLRNIQSIQPSNRLMAELFCYLQPINYTAFYAEPQTESRYFTEVFPLLRHVEFRSFTVETLYTQDLSTPKGNRNFTEEKAEFYRRILAQRTREREGRPELTFSWK